MPHTGWLRVLANAGYEVRHGNGERSNFGGDPSIYLSVWKDGEQKMYIEQNHDGQGGKSLGQLYRKAAIDLGLHAPKPLCDEVPVELTVEHRGGMHPSDEYRHPSFGVVAINRYSSTDDRHFMSPVNTGGGMMLRVSTAYMVHNTDLGSESVYGGKVLVDVHMSFAQFAEMVTGMGTEVPCTLQYADGITIPQMPDMTTRFDRIEENMARTMQEGVAEVRALLKELGPEMNGPGGLSASRKKEVWKRITQGLSGIDTKPRWLGRVFKEATNDMLKHAKVEFVGFVDRMRMSATKELGASAPEVKALDERTGDGG